MLRHARPLLSSLLLGLIGAVALLLLAGAGRSASAAPALEVNAPDAGGVNPTAATTLSALDGQNFGSSAATAGDVNGDGYTDLIVGDPLPASFAGRVRVYMGTSAGINSTPALTLTGAAGDRLGTSVNAAGDVNGDGYGDVVIGAMGFSGQIGRAYVYHGGASGLSGTPAQTLTGEAALNNFGAVVAPAGDVNNDNFADIIVSAYGYSSTTGRAYVYHGSPSGIAATAALTLTGETGFAQFGISVATAGDVNGDGFADVLVGSDWVANSTGKAYLYHGSGAGLTATPALTLTGPGTFQGFGRAVSTAGDLNGDGYSDVAIGATANNNTTGTVKVFLGSGVGLSATPALSLTGEALQDAFGATLATAGDVNGDGYADFVVGAEQYSGGGFTGRAYIYHGGASLSATPVLTLTGVQIGSAFGNALSPAGDVNGDGWADLVIASRTEFGGRVRVYHGAGGTASALPNTTLNGEEGGSEFGNTAATAGDVNGDGYADVIVGAPGFKSSLGGAYLYLGSAAGLNQTPAVPLTGESTDRFGTSVSTAGDVNGDGYADVIIGAAALGSNNGRAYIYLGQVGGIAATPVLTITGDTGSRLGTSVATAGDVNGDGYADVIIGAPVHTTSTGRAYVHLGSATGLSATPALTLTGEATNSSFGVSVASAGDVNRDGYSDVIVGAPQFSGSLGRAYVYYGSAGGLRATGFLTLTGEAAGDSFGGVVASAGDVNGDGFAEVVVGAASYPAGGGTGRAYVYSGGLSGLSSTPSATLTGAGANYAFGASAATAGDVNGDGYADVVIGAPQDGGSPGQAFVYHGSGAGLAATPALTLTGDSNGIAFGALVATAGDVNGDGYAEVVVGAPSHDSEVGKAEVFAGNGGYGLAHAQRTRRHDDSGPVAYLGASPSMTQFRLNALGRLPFGTGRVSLQWEVKPLGTAFNGQGLVQGAGWIYSPGTGVELGELVNAVGINSAQHWRVRILYKPSGSPFAQHSRWLTQPWNGHNETRLRVDRTLVFIPYLRRK